MLTTLSEITIFLKLLQFLNDFSPILVTLSGITMLVKPLQLLNAQSPMLVTLFGIVILVKLLQFRKACDGIFPPVIVTDFMLDGIR